MARRITDSISQEIRTLDLERLRELEDFDSHSQSESLVLSIINLFLATTPSLFEKLGQHLESFDFDQISKSAHSLKSSCSNIGAMKLASMCLELENCKEAMQIPDPSQITAVQAEFSQVCADLRTILRDT